MLSSNRIEKHMLNSVSEVPQGSGTSKISQHDVVAYVYHDSNIIPHVMVGFLVGLLQSSDTPKL